MKANGGEITVRELARMGGKARMAGLSKNERSALASRAARARWGMRRTANTIDLERMELERASRSSPEDNLRRLIEISETIRELERAVDG